VEDEIGDGAAQSAKLRPMRVEMYLRVHTKPKTSYIFTHTRKCIAAGSGENT